MAEKMYIATGRRKTSTAVVKLVKGKGRVFVNGKTLAAYIGNRPALEMMIFRPLALTDNQTNFDVRVKVVGLHVMHVKKSVKSTVAKEQEKDSNSQNVNPFWLCICPDTVVVAKQRWFKISKILLFLQEDFFIV